MKVLMNAQMEENKEGIKDILAKLDSEKKHGAKLENDIKKLRFNDEPSGLKPALN
jgi:hypothetical protein